MDTELLVDERVEDGRRFLSELAASGFDITVAFWVRTSDEGLWYLYIASSAVERGKIGDAYGVAYAALSRLTDLSITLSDMRLVRPTDPVAVDATAVRNRYPARIDTHYRGTNLGGLAIDEAYIYGPIDVDLNQFQILQTVLRLMGRKGALPPSRVTLRDGSSFNALPIAIQRPNSSGGALVELFNLDTGSKDSFPIDQIANIQ